MTGLMIRRRYNLLNNVNVAVDNSFWKLKIYIQHCEEFKTKSDYLYDPLDRLIHFWLMDILFRVKSDCKVGTQFQQSLNRDS